MISLHRLFTVSAFLAVVVSLAAVPLSAEEPPSGTPPAPPAEAEATEDDVSPQIFFGGLRVVVDPETDRIVSDPPRKSLADFTLDPVLLPRLSTSSEGLVEQPGPHGGVMVDLQGRFASATVAVIDDDGNLRMDHVSLAREASDQDAEDFEDAEEADDDTP